MKEEETTQCEICSKFGKTVCDYPLKNQQLLAKDSSEFRFSISELNPHSSRMSTETLKYTISSNDSTYFNNKENQSNLTQNYTRSGLVGEMNSTLPWKN